MPAGERGLESPFLRATCPAHETEDSGPPRPVQLARLETESPFLRPIQTFADQEGEEPTKRGTATADAFVADADGKAYFTTFPQLGDLTTRQATVLSPANFENLMDHVLASKEQNFVIDAHGDPSGLHMPLAEGTKIAATKRAFFMLAGIDRVRALMRLAEESNTIWERASGTDLERWRSIVATMHSKTWHDMIGDPWPTKAPGVDTVDAAKSVVRSRISALVNGLFPVPVPDRPGRVDRLIDKMLKLQAKGIHEVQFRACNIGKDSGTLREFRRFFGADRLCAPDVRTGMGRVSPSISPAGVEALARRALAQAYDLRSGRFVIVIDVSGASFKALCAGTTQAAVSEWVAAHLMAQSRYRTGAFPIHFLETQPRFFALDPEYATHIKCSSSVWDQAVGAGELEEEAADRDAAASGVAPAEVFESESSDPDFERQVGGGAGAVDPFPRHPYVLSLKMTNERFIACAETVENDPLTKPMCGAVADVTGNPDLPAFYAHNPVDMLYVGSLAKIYPMYVAFELRKRVEEQARDMIKLGLSTSTPGWERKVFAALEKAWKPKLKAPFRTTLPETMPKFSEIVVLAPTGTASLVEASFVENNPPLTDADLDLPPPHPKADHPPISPEFKTPPGKFYDWMRLMLRWSNNEAASKCIRALGYSYINGVLGAAGFFDQRARVGLWMSGDYLGNDWLPGNRAGPPLTPRWARLQARATTNFAGTAFQVARLLTLLAQGRLVDRDSSTKMLGIMTGVAGIGSYIRGGLAGATPARAFTTIASKIGCGDEVPPPACGFTHDCAIVRVNAAIRYVVVALGGHPDQAKADLRKMVVRFHDCVIARHP
jgi:Beta-lactamase enzyme family